jgi:hypothetical protein
MNKASCPEFYILKISALSQKKKNFLFIPFDFFKSWPITIIMIQPQAWPIKVLLGAMPMPMQSNQVLIGTMMPFKYSGSEYKQTTI